MLLPVSMTLSTPLCRMPGTSSRARRCFKWAMTGTMSMFMGQAWAQRPQPVHTQGKLEATTSSSRPSEIMRMTLRVSYFSMPGMPVIGQPLEQAPQVRQRPRSYFLKCFRTAAGSSFG